MPQFEGNSWELLLASTLDIAEGLFQVAERPDNFCAAQFGFSAVAQLVRHPTRCR